MRGAELKLSPSGTAKQARGTATGTTGTGTGMHGKRREDKAREGTDGGKASNSDSDSDSDRAAGDPPPNWTGTAGERSARALDQQEERRGSEEERGKGE